MFIGEFTHSLDSKGRISIPSKFRDKLSENAVITKGFDKNLFIFPQEQWEKKAQKLASRSSYKANIRALKRHMLAGAMDVEIDNQGRVLIPNYLRDYADLDDKVVIAGLYNQLELWDEEKWEQRKQERERNSEDIAEKLGDLEML